MSTLALIPARAGSKGILGKNMRTLGGKTLIQHAAECARASGCEPVVSTDYSKFAGRSMVDWDSEVLADAFILPRPAELASDTASMLAVVQHALQQIPGPPEQIIVLLQPTQPFRTPQHVRQAIALLQDPVEHPDSVVSVRELDMPLEWVLRIDGRHLEPLADGYSLDMAAVRRQDGQKVYKRDGTVYAFYRRIVDGYNSLYGHWTVPLIIPASESCELDTEADWASVERRWQELDRVRC